MQTENSADGGRSRSTVELGGEADILTRLMMAQCGSCSCMTKTPEPQYHAPHCATRVLQEAAEEITALRTKAARWDAIETLMILGAVELTQAEDGGYSIYVEPVENIVPTSWDGGTPDEAADKVVAQLTTPNV